MQQLELFPLNFDHSLVKKIKYWRYKIRKGEKDIFKRERNKRKDYQSIMQLTIVGTGTKLQVLPTLLSLY